MALLVAIKSVSKDEIQFIGNILIFAFAGRYNRSYIVLVTLRLCNQKYKQELINSR